MPYETDLPCSDCGGSLLERDVPSRDLAAGAEMANSVGTEAANTVVVAECTDCGARHYPDGTLRRLFEGSEPPATAGGR